MSRHYSIHSTIPILEIVASPGDLVELLDFLQLNNIAISPYDRAFKKTPETVSLNQGTLYAFVETGLKNQRRVSFYEDNSLSNSRILRIISSWVRNRPLKILRSRLSDY
jgi:hypothetical protein